MMIALSSDPLENRFLKRVEINQLGCWEWTAYTNKGYARFNVNGKVVDGHRWFYQYKKGSLKKDQHLDHLCRNRRCVNPDHLEVVTSRENTLRGNSLAAKRARQTHCLRGHEFTKENTSMSKNNQRRCKKCHAFRERRRRSK